MNMLNSLIIEGDVTRRLEKNPRCSDFELVSVRYNKVDGEMVEEKDYFTVEVFGKLAEISEDKLVNGRGVRVIGRLKQHRWKDEEGKEYSRVVVIAEHIEFKRYVTPEERA